jgi:hypothetical protein
MNNQNRADKVSIGVVMGSDSDWDVMQHACKTLDEFAISYERQIVSAHRTPDLLYQYAESAIGRGLKVIIAGAGGAAHLPGMLAAKTTIPVLGVPVNSRHLKGITLKAWIPCSLSYRCLQAYLLPHLLSARPVPEMQLYSPFPSWQHLILNWRRNWLIFDSSKQMKCCHAACPIAD